MAMKLIVFVTLFRAITDITAELSGASINVTFPKCTTFGKNISFIKFSDYVLFC